MKRPRLELDYVSAPHRPAWLGLLLLALALGIGADLVWRLTQARDERSSMSKTQELLNSSRPPAKAMAVERLDEQVKSAETVVSQLTLPWASLIAVLENVASKDVALLLVQPDAQQRRLRFSAEARNHKAMLQYLNNLAAAGGIEEVHLLSHQVRLDDPQRPVLFSAQAAFRATP